MQLISLDSDSARHPPKLGPTGQLTPRLLPFEPPTPPGPD